MSHAGPSASHSSPERDICRHVIADGPALSRSNPPSPVFLASSRVLSRARFFFQDGLVSPEPLSNNTLCRRRRDSVFHLSELPPSSRVAVDEKQSLRLDIKAPCGPQGTLPLASAGPARHQGLSLPGPGIRVAQLVTRCSQSPLRVRVLRL